ncbi:GCN5-related N-acetyltransferase [Actinobacteria bacterium OK006]|nr:GCN5-related N-acetyltransferase [Actinobacteria bacterium OK006]
MDPVTLETARLLLRPFGLSDADAVYAACQDEDIQYYTPAPSPYRREDAERYVGETAPQGWAGDRDHILGAFRSDNGALVGSFCLTRLSEGVYELGYWAAKEQRGRGYSAEAARVLCDWGFAVLGAHRIEWWAMVGNVPSRALAEKLGFTVEGTLRRRTVVRGEPRDWWVGGLLKP